MISIVLSVPEAEATQILEKLAEIWKKQKGKVSPELQKTFVVLADALMGTQDVFLLPALAEKWMNTIDWERVRETNAEGVEKDTLTAISTSTLMLIAKVSALLKMPPDELMAGTAIWSNNSDVPMLIIHWDAGVTVRINHHLPNMVQYALKGVCSEHDIVAVTFCPHEDGFDADDDGDDEDEKDEVKVAVADAEANTKH